MGKHIISPEALSFVGWWVGTFGFNTIITFPKHEVPWEETPSYFNAMEQSFWKEPRRRMRYSVLTLSWSGV